MEGTKKLTQGQKVYFIKRIDEITAQKISKVRKIQVTANQVQSNYAYNSSAYQIIKIPKKTLDRGAWAGIASGKVKLLSKKDVIARIKSRLDDGKDTAYANVNSIEFIDQNSLAEFNKARHVKSKKDKEAIDTRLGAIQEEAAELKDKVMLESNLAIGMLEKFEKKEF